MRIMSRNQEQVLAELVDLAGGNIRVVEEALTVAGEGATGEDALRQIVDYIIERAPASEAGQQQSQQQSQKQSQKSASVG